MTQISIQLRPSPVNHVLFKVAYCITCILVTIQPVILYYWSRSMMIDFSANFTVYMCAWVGCIPFSRRNYSLNRSNEFMSLNLNWNRRKQLPRQWSRPGPTSVPGSNFVTLLTGCTSPHTCTTKRIQERDQIKVNLDHFRCEPRPFFRFFEPMPRVYLSKTQILSSECTYNYNQEVINQG